MLTVDLIRVVRRQQAIHPRYLDTGSADLARVAAQLLDVYARAGATVPGWTKKQVGEAVADLVSERTDPLLFRGLHKLLEDRAEYGETSPIDPVEMRRRLFQAAALVSVRRSPLKSWALKRKELLSEMGRQIEASEEVIEESLYADLEDNQRLTGFRSLKPVQLLERYNLALAQGVLLRATKMEIVLEAPPVGALRQVLRDLKFHQLIHTLHQVGDSSLRIEVDGPLSLFSNSRRYGVAMAQFLPSLMHLTRFELVARVMWGHEQNESVFKLDEKRGLKPIRRSQGQYITQEQTWFEERFALDPGPWRMERTHDVLLTESGEVVVPDLRFEHGEDGRQAFLEILGFWRRGSLEKRVAQIGDPGLAGLLLAVSRGMVTDKEEQTADHPRIVWFKQVLSAKAVKDKLDALAVARQR